MYMGYARENQEINFKSIPVNQRGTNLTSSVAQPNRLNQSGPLQIDYQNTASENQMFAQ